MTTFPVDPEALVLVQRNWTVYHTKWANVEAGLLDDEDLVLIQRHDEIFHMRIGDYRSGAISLGEFDFVWANLLTRDRNEFVPTWKHFHFPWTSVRGLEFNLVSIADAEHYFSPDALSIKVEGARPNWDGEGPYVRYPDGTKKDIHTSNWQLNIKAKDPATGAQIYQDGDYLLVGQFQFVQFENSGALSNIKISEELWNMMFWWAPGTQIDSVQNHTFRANSLGKEMFKNCKNFQGNIDPNGWNNLRFRNFERMFQFCWSFDQDVSGMIAPPDRNKAVAMFYGATNYNNDGQPLTLGMQSCEDMSYMFNDCKSFNVDVSSLNTSRVTNMNGLFDKCQVFNQPVGTWNTSNVKDMGFTFANCQVFDQDLGSWDTANVEIAWSMFEEAKVFNNGGSDSIKYWDVSNVKQFAYMFFDALVFNQPVGSWETTSHQDADSFDSMFAWALEFDQNLTGWCVDKVSQVPEDFAKRTKIDGDLTKLPVWGTCP